MATKLKATPLSCSSSSDSEEDDTAIQERIKRIEEQSNSNRSRKRLKGGLIISSDYDVKKNSISESLSAAEKKGLKEVEELERELDLKNTFSKETNRRDEDAEMNRHIDEQIKRIREANKRLQHDESSTSKGGKSDFSEIFTLPATSTNGIDDILLHSLSKELAQTVDEKSEAMLSSQMLNGIPEVDLGLNERIRTIEATEEAKLKLATASLNRNHERSTVRLAPVNYSTNFRQHRMTRDTHDGEMKTTRMTRQPAASSTDPKTVVEPVVVVGEEPEQVQYKLPQTGHRPPPRGRASDDYFVSKFKRNNRK